MSDLAEQSTAGFPPVRRRRLSAWRLILAIFIVVVLVGTGYGGWYMWSSARAVASYDPWFAGYVDVTATPTYAFESPAGEAEKNVVLSFIVASTDDPCVPTWGTYYTLDAAAESLDLDRRVARLAQVGGKATISFGGAINNELATGCTDHNALVDAYAEVLDRYDASTIDLDIEFDNLKNAEAGQRRAEAIESLQSERRAAGNDLHVWLTLPVAPFGLTDDGVAAVDQMLAAGVDLTGVNVMTMEYGESRDADDSMATASIAALNATHEQLTLAYADVGAELTAADIWSKIGATPMIGQNGTVADVFTLADAAELNLFAQNKQLGRMSMWSLNRDRACSPNYVDVTRVSDSCSGIDQGEQLFSVALSNRFEGTAVPADMSSTTVPTQPPPVAVDDPLTSPYEVWSADPVFQKGAKVVWHGNVYQAKWWSLGDTPDNPALKEFETPWSLLGPVLAGDAPRIQIELPVGTYGDWSSTAAYDAGTRVLVAGVPYEARWWTQAESPVATRDTGEVGPWRILTAEEVTEALAPIG